MSDNVSPELRKVEQEIDNAYKTNYLTTLSFSESAWYLLATIEDIPLMTFSGRKNEWDISLQDITTINGNLQTQIKHPLNWLYKDCKKGKGIPYTNNKKAYNSARELIDLGEDYLIFEIVYTSATKGITNLSLDNNEIIVEYNLQRDFRYESYNRLLKPNENINFDFSPILELLKPKVKVKGDRFDYKINPQIVEIAKSVIKPSYEKIFTLPFEWQFSKYSIGEYFEFVNALGAMAFIHWSAHYIAAAKGCIGGGYNDSIKIFDTEELFNRIARYSGLDKKIVKIITEDLIYGNHDIKRPDLPLQPLVQITEAKLALAPYLWISNNVERNFIVLMNRLPSEKKIYSELVNKKEMLMREQIQTSLVENNKPYRFVNGKLPNSNHLPDIDLAVISDNEKICLFLELKWFIEPAEFHETMHRNEDLEKGIEQLNDIRKEFDKKSKPLFDKLQIDESYKAYFTLVSMNSIGDFSVQDMNIPIINQSHLIKKILSEGYLLTVCDWLQKRNYLPVENIHYTTVDISAEISNWKIKWYGIKPIIEHTFLPV